MIFATVAAIAVGMLIPSDASAFTGDPSSVWNTLVNPNELIPWEQSLAGGELGYAEEQAVMDGVCLVFGIECITAAGALALVSGGIIAIDAVWKSGLGNELGNWIANFGSPATAGLGSANITGESWCSVTYSTYDGVFGTNLSESPYTYNGGGGSCGGVPVQGYQIPDATPTVGGKSHFVFSFQTTGCTFAGSTTTSTALILASPLLLTGASTAEQNCAIAIGGLLGSYGISTQQTYNNGDVMSPGSGTQTCAQEAVQVYTANGGPTPSGYTGKCIVITASDDQMAQMLGPTQLQPCGGTGQIACPTSPTLTLGSATAGVGAGTKPCLACLNKLDSNNPHTGRSGDTPSTQGTEGEINCFLQGATTCPTTSPSTITLPRPQITETYAQYIARLRALGFWGTIYDVDDDMDYPAGTPAYQLVPQQITEVQIGTLTPMELYWPAPGHGLSGAPSSTPNAGQYKQPQDNFNQTVNANTPITILKVPDSWAGGGGGNGPCNCPGIDFSPLTGLSYGTAFPFGVFTFLNNANSSFTGAGSGTPISFSLPVGGGSQTITLASTSWETTYRPIVFGILEFLMTLAGVVWLALRVIGHPGGDAEGTD